MGDWHPCKRPRQLPLMLDSPLTVLVREWSAVQARWLSP